MSIASYIKVIGRGKEGARALNQAQAHDLMSQVLDGRVSDLEIGAFALAMRIKGETGDELAGFLQAAEERCLHLAPPRPAVLLASYNGARRLPNLTPLLALLLARAGLAVLVHGPLQDPGRVTSAMIFEALGLPSAGSAADVQAAWERREPAFIAIETLSPPLAKLLAVRWTVGLRNSGHTIAKLLDPCLSEEGPRALRVISYTHPEYGKGHADFLAATRANAMLLRGTEGEPVADARRQPKLDVFIDGAWREDLSRPAQEGSLRELPELPRDCDPAATAAYTRALLSGELATPQPLQAQVEAILRAIEAMAATPAQAPAP